MKTIALCCADIHLSERPPLARSLEQDWMEVQWRALNQLTALASACDCPIVCAGDVFDRYNPSPFLINWAIANLPKMYAVPGQHDLPLHNRDDIKRSAYWTLVEAGTLIDVVGCHQWASLELSAAQWEDSIPTPGRCKLPQLLIAHRYVWVKGAVYPHAPKEHKLSALASSLHGYTGAVFGDNHIPFTANAGGCNVVNCGCFIQRKSDERSIQPSVWRFMEDGTFKRQRLAVDRDVWTEEEHKVEVTKDVELDEFLQELGTLETGTWDFRESVHEYLRRTQVKEPVRKAILESMGE